MLPISSEGDCLDDELHQAQRTGFPDTHLNSPLTVKRIQEFKAGRGRSTHSSPMLAYFSDARRETDIHTMMGKYLVRIGPSDRPRDLGPDEEAARQLLEATSACLGEYTKAGRLSLGYSWRSTRSLANTYAKEQALFEDIVLRASSSESRGSSETYRVTLSSVEITYNKGIICCYAAGEKCVGDYLCLLMWSDIVNQRAKVFRASEIASGAGASGYPSEQTLAAVLNWGDTVLSKHGNASYTVIKEYEALCTSEIHTRGTTVELGDPQSFRRSMLGELQDLSTGLNDPEILELVPLLASVETVAELSQLFGLYRFWGHPFVQTMEGVAANRKIACEQKHIPGHLSDVVTATFVRTFVNSFLRKEGRYPRILEASLQTCPEIQNAMAIGAPLPMRTPVEELLSVVFEKEFSYEGVTALDLLSDKALGLGRKELAIACAQRKKGDWRKRRSLLDYLGNEDVDIARLLETIDANGIDNNEATIGVTPKERELKTSPRLFSLLTAELKYYFGSTEHLIAREILKYFPQITMADNLQDVIRKLIKMTKAMSPRVRGIVTVVINIDFKKWNLQMRDGHTKKIFSRMDHLFGLSGVISRTHEIFKQCLFYVFDGENWCDTAQGEIVENEKAWSGQEGGVEGLRQKGWTIVTVCALLTLLEGEGIRFTMVGQGDNQVLALHFDVYDYDDVSGQPSDNECRRIKTAYATMHTKMTDFFGEFSLPMKSEESWSSSRFFTYGKTPIFEGVALPMSLKRQARMFLCANESYPSLYGSVAGIFTNAQAATSFDYTFWVSYHLAVEESCRAILRLGAYHPLFNGPFRFDNYHTQKAGQHYSAKISPDDVEYLLRLMLGHVTVGGLPVQTPLEFLSRGFPDPLSSYLAWSDRLKPHLTTPARAYLETLSRPLERPGEPDLIMLFEDPLSLNSILPSRQANIMRSSVSRVLQSDTVVRNPAIKRLINLGVRQDADLITLLGQTSPLAPMVMKDILDVTPSGHIRELLGKFETTKTIRLVALEMGIPLLTRIQMSERDILAVAILQSELAGKPRLHQCPSAHAQHLRESSWKRNDIYGVTTPHPFHYLGPFDSFLGIEENCLVTSISKDLSLSCWQTTLGPYKPYIADATREGIPQANHYNLKAKDTLLRKVLHLQRIVGRLVAVGSPLDFLLAKLMSAVTDLPTTALSTPSQDEVGNFLFRHNSKYVGHGGLFNGMFSSYTHLSSDSWLLKDFREGQNAGRPLHFQSMFSSIQHLALLKGCGVGTEYSMRVRNDLVCDHCLEASETMPMRGPEALRGFVPTSFRGVAGLWTDKADIAIESSSKVPELGLIRSVHRISPMEAVGALARHIAVYQRGKSYIPDYVIGVWRESLRQVPFRPFMSMVKTWSVAERMRESCMTGTALPWRTALKESAKGIWLRGRDMLGVLVDLLLERDSLARFCYECGITPSSTLYNGEEEVKNCFLRAWNAVPWGPEHTSAVVVEDECACRLASLCTLLRTGPDAVEEEIIGLVKGLENTSRLAADSGLRVGSRELLHLLELEVPKPVFEEHRLQLLTWLNADRWTGQSQVVWQSRVEWSPEELNLLTLAHTIPDTAGAILAIDYTHSGTREPLAVAKRRQLNFSSVSPLMPGGGLGESHGICLAEAIKVLSLPQPVWLLGTRISPVGVGLALALPTLDCTVVEPTVDKGRLQGDWGGILHQSVGGTKVRVKQSKNPILPGCDDVEDQNATAVLWCEGNYLNEILDNLQTNLVVAAANGLALMVGLPDWALGYHTELACLCAGYYSKVTLLAPNLLDEESHWYLACRHPTNEPPTESSPQLRNLVLLPLTPRDLEKHLSNRAPYDGFRAVQTLLYGTVEDRLLSIEGHMRTRIFGLPSFSTAESLKEWARRGSLEEQRVHQFSPNKRKRYAKRGVTDLTTQGLRELGILLLSVEDMEKETQRDLGNCWVCVTEKDQVMAVVLVTSRVGVLATRLAVHERSTRWYKECRLYATTLREYETRVLGG